jgi:hypothetical protein
MNFHGLVCISKRDLGHQALQGKNIGQVTRTGPRGYMPEYYFYRVRVNLRQLKGHVYIVSMPNCGLIVIGNSR